MAVWSTCYVRYRMNQLNFLASFIHVVLILHAAHLTSILLMRCVIRWLFPLTSHDVCCLTKSKKVDKKCAIRFGTYKVRENMKSGMQKCTIRNQIRQEKVILDKRWHVLGGYCPSLQKCCFLFLYFMIWLGESFGARKSLKKVFFIFSLACTTI